jgi:hypothetical protein
MSMSRKFLLVFLALLLVPALSLAQQRPRLQVTQVRIGFPVGSPAADVELAKTEPLFKAGCWAPIAIDISVSPPGLKGNEGPLEITVETPDPDDVATNYTVTRPLEAIGPNGTFTVNTYTKLANTSSTITVTLKAPESVAVGPPYKRDHPGINSGMPLFVTVGSLFPALRLAVKAGDRGNNVPQLQIEGIGFINRFQDMPDQWFGYDGVDLLVLSTSRRNDFLADMASEQAPRRRVEALTEWVQRGGQLLVCVGKNYAALKDIPELDGQKGLLPVAFKKTAQLRGVHLVWPDGHGGAGGALGSAMSPLEVAIPEDKPGRNYSTRLAIREGGLAELPLIIQAPYGLGRVTVVAFDLDQKPFADWGTEKEATGQIDFWSRLIQDASGRSVVGNNNDMDDRQGRRFMVGGDEEPNELVYQLQNHLENFEEVPVISFGWVALFILIYILVVGPLDYIFLKKVVKRLELTWITFPTVVIVVSAVAYFTAYQLKGHDLRIRKVDVVDVDLQTQQSVGRTWFTVFSPRIQHYTVGIEPAPGWAAPAENGSPGSVVVSWMERPQLDMYGNRGRSRGQSLFRRAYKYENNAAGLEGVPIQVWSTKSFAASWQAPLPAGQPLVAANLRHPAADVSAVSGEITWQPGQPGTDLEDVTLIYNGRALRAKNMVPGTPVRVDSLRLGSGDALSGWVRQSAGPDVSPNTSRRPTSAPQTNGEATVKTMMFYQALETGGRRNNALRFLDQTWRAREGKDEVILVGRLKTRQDAADAVTQMPESATRLWLGALPGPGATRPELIGQMRQETYVRVYIPVQTNRKAN